MGKKRILIIDDEENFTQLVKLNLEKTDKYEVMIENRGSHGLAAAKKFKPDLILLDILMPDTEGTEVGFQIKNDKNTKDIPIVFLTAVAEKKDVDRCDGVISGHPFIAKPVSADKLIEVIEKNIG